MNKQQLIELLASMPDDAEVFADDSEYGPLAVIGAHEEDGRIVLDLSES